jgi:hypothetical protein
MEETDGETNTATIFKFTDRIFRRYLHYHFLVKKLPTKSLTESLRR